MIACENFEKAKEAGSRLPNNMEPYLKEVMQRQAEAVLKLRAVCLLLQLLFPQNLRN